MGPPASLFVVTDNKGVDESITAQAFQITADGSLCFGNVQVEPGQQPQIEITQVYNKRVWDKMRKSPLQPVVGMRTQ